MARLSEQESELRESIAGFIALKLLELRGDSGSIRGRGDFFSALPKETVLMKMVQDKLVNPRLIKDQCASASATSGPARVPGRLVRGADTVTKIIDEKEQEVGLGRGSGEREHDGRHGCRTGTVPAR